jgi:hypothetical protein
MKLAKKQKKSFVCVGYLAEELAYSRGGDLSLCLKAVGNCSSLSSLEQPPQSPEARFVAVFPVAPLCNVIPP